MNLCSNCGADFTGVSTFDRHQVENYDKPPFVTCLDPNELGMSKDGNGRWGFPGSVTAVNYTPAAQRPDKDYERECVECGATFMRPRRRGRPPKACESCRGVAA